MASQAVLELLVQLKDQASSGLASLGGALSTVGGIAGGVALAGVGAFTAALASGVGDAREAAQVMAQTEAVIKSTGGAAGFTAEQISDMAASLSAAEGRSLFGDSDIQQGQNLLLTFTNIKETLPDATEIMLDMAQAMGTDVKGGAIQLGKALNDPVAGISALSRVGVTFTEQQKAQIEAMVKAGDTAAAQRVILAELNKEFGGSAQAAADADGGWAQFNDRLGEAKEALGAAVLPLLGVLVGFLNDHVMPVLEDGASAFEDFIAVLSGGEIFEDSPIARFAPMIRSALEVLDTGRDIVTDFFAILSGGEVFEDSPIAQFAPMIREIMEVIDTGRDIVTDFFTILSGGEIFEDSPVAAYAESIRGLMAVFSEGGAASQVLAEAVSGLQQRWEAVSGLLQAIIPVIRDVVLAVFGEIQTFLNAHGEDILAFLTSTWHEINDIISLAAELIKAIVVPIFTFIAGFIKAHSAEIQTILGASWTAIKAIVDTALTLIRGVITAALQIIQGDWSGAWETIKAMSARVVENLITIFRSNLEILKTIFSGVIDNIKRTLEGMVSSAAQIGRNIIDGIIRGVQNAAGTLFNAMRDMASNALEAATDALGISSPSREFAELVGEPIVTGIARGITTMLPFLDGVFADVAAGMLAKAKKVTDKVRDEIARVVADMEKQAAEIGRSVNEAMSSGFGAEASIDRLIARNIDALAEVSDKARAYAQQQLNTATEMAAQFTDPARGADFLKMRSDQIFELAELQDRLNEATDAKERARIEQQIDLISKAQVAEQRAFRAESANQKGPVQQLTEQLQAFLSNPNMPGILDSPVVKQMQALLRDLQNNTGGFAFAPATPSAAGAGGAGGMVDSRGFTINNTFNLPPGSDQATVDAVIRKLNQQTNSRRQ